MRASGLQKEFAKLLAEDNVDRPATELHEANNLLASQIIMEALVDDSMDAKQRTEAAKSIASLQRAQVSNEKLKIEARKEQGAVHVAMDLLKEKVFSEIGQNYPEIAAKLLELAENTEKRVDADAVTDSREKRAHFLFLWLRQGIVAQRGIKGLFKAVKAVFKAVKKHAVALLRPEGCGQKWKAGKRRLQRTGMTACGSRTYRCFWRFHGRAYQRI